MGARTAKPLALENASPSTRLLEKWRQIFEVQEALEAQKNEYALKVRACCCGACVRQRATPASPGAPQARVLRAHTHVRTQTHTHTHPHTRRTCSASARRC
jgi:hypothetical protein